MTKPPAKAGVPHDSGSSSILVWNGLVTRMRLGCEDAGDGEVGADVEAEQERVRVRDRLGGKQDCSGQVVEEH